jgi:hypothetical protein
VINSVIAAGLVLQHLGEHPEPFWDHNSNLTPDMVRRLPHTFTLIARRPSPP